jgi:calcineurin-like phosphoesterase family protein
MTTISGHHRRRFRLQLLPVIATLLVCMPSAMAQQTADRTTEATPWTHQDFADSQSEFQFAVVSDNAANPREGVFQAALAKLQILRPEFVLSVGDFIHGYNEEGKPLTEEEVVRKKRRRFDDALGTLSMPFYRVAGNHDFNNDLSAGIWKELYGPDYYSFVYKDVLFLCLNSQDGANYGAGIGQEQIAWAKDEISKHGDVRWICLFFHQPLWLEDEKRLAAAKDRDKNPRLTGFNEIEKLLVGRSYTVFAGHHHRYGKWVKDGQKYFRLATTGGQSALAGPKAGQFDHVMWITMTDKGPLVCNLMLEGILDEDAKRNLPREPMTGK